MRLTFWGAARQVTGSMFLLELEDDFRILIDCGMDMERKDVNPEDYIGVFPFEPSFIQAVILTHAHIDHSGYIPNLFSEGFEGRIICTHATLELTEVLLRDSANINQKKLNRLNKRRRKRPNSITKEDLKGLYFNKQVNESLEYFLPVEFNKIRQLTENINITFIPAGHLLGASHVVLEINEKGENKTICFSGDIGRYNYPLLPDPQAVPQVDYLVTETTYGNRHHFTKESPEDAIYDIIQSTCVDISGRLIVPAFSVGRTQAMLYTLNRLRVAGKLPAIKVFTDSPLALKSTKVYEKYKNGLNQEAKEFAKNNGNLFDFDNLVYLENLKDSKALANYTEPCIIISSSGMIQGGRIEYHVKQNLNNPYATILMIGYSAEGTLGHELTSGKKVLKFQKREVHVSARIERIDVFSGHGDKDDLMKFVEWQNSADLKKLFLVHGDYESMQDFAQNLTDKNYQNIEMPKRGESFEL